MLFVVVDPGPTLSLRLSYWITELVGVRQSLIRHGLFMSVAGAKICNCRRLPWLGHDTQKKGEAVGEIIYKEQSFQIVGACFEVYNEMGCGFLEAVYQECLAIEFPLRNIPFVAQHELRLWYKKKTLGSTYKPDFICHDRIIVEIKAVTELLPKHRAQVHNYLKATDSCYSCYSWFLQFDLPTVILLLRAHVARGDRTSLRNCRAPVTSVDEQHPRDPGLRRPV